MHKAVQIISSLLFASTVASQAFGAINPDQIYLTETKKKNFYINEGLFVGGDRAINDVVIQDIRTGQNAGFERVVIDISGSKNGHPAVIERPPYYQVAYNRDEKKVIFSVWGNPKLNFEPEKVMRSLKKSKLIKQVELLPKVEPELWTFAIHLEKGNAVEVFELSTPVRIIVDLRQRK